MQEKPSLVIENESESDYCFPTPKIHAGRLAAHLTESVIEPPKILSNMCLKKMENLESTTSKLLLEKVSSPLISNEFSALQALVAA